MTTMTVITCCLCSLRVLTTGADGFSAVGVPLQELKVIITAVAAVKQI